MSEEAINTDWLRDALLPENGPPEDIYRLAVPIWCEQSHDDLAEQLGAEFGCGFADGFRAGVVMAMLRPEWAQGFYHNLREYYLTTHTPEDLLDWEECADSTARAIPVRSLSMERPDLRTDSKADGLGPLHPKR